jgi:CxxC motif-containing protein
MKELRMCCTTCPNSCALTVQVEGETIVSVEGNKCKRGLDFAEQERIDPKRMLTSTMILRTSSGERSVPVKSALPMSRAKMQDAMAVIRAASLSHGVHIGDVLIPDVADSGVDIVASKTVG